jgi:hypothetical protein
MPTALLLAATLSAHAAPLRTAAWATLGTGAALDALGWTLTVQAGHDSDFTAIGTGILGFTGVGLASVARNTSVALTMVDAQRAGADRTAGWVAVGGTAASFVGFWGGGFAAAGLGNKAPAETTWWPVTNGLLRLGSYGALAWQLRENGLAEGGSAKVRLGVRPDGVALRGRF